MKKLGKSTIVLLALAAILLVGSAVGSTRAALTYYSEYYGAEITVSNIGVSLIENDELISFRNYDSEGNWNIQDGELLANMLAEDEKLTLGKDYKEELKVLNSGEIESYVRVILTKNWVNEAGVPDQTLDPGLIELEIVDNNGWVVDEKASTPERTVLYYTKKLDVNSETTPFTSTLSINPILQTKFIKHVEKDGNFENISYEYEYDGYSFNVEVEADAVQTHNAVDAIKSAWGVDVTVAGDGSISLQ